MNTIPRLSGSFPELWCVERYGTRGPPPGPQTKTHGASRDEKLELPNPRLSRSGLEKPLHRRWGGPKPPPEIKSQVSGLRPVPPIPREASANHTTRSLGSSGQTPRYLKAPVLPGSWQARVPLLLPHTESGHRSRCVQSPGRSCVTLGGYVY